jgi:alpha-1,6-mannosyltransferase
VLHCTQFNELRNAIAIRYGTSTGIWFVLLSMTQFHVPYYAGRTLQNFIALPFGASAFAFAFAFALAGIQRYSEYRPARM